MSKAEQLADELIQIARYPSVRINATDPAIQKEAATLLRAQDALLRQALDALDYAADMTKPEGLSGCDCPICTTTQKLQEHLK